MTKEFYTTREVAQMLNVDPQTIRRHIRVGNLKALLINHTYIVNKSDLDAYLDERNTKGKRNNGES